VPCETQLGGTLTGKSSQHQNTPTSSPISAAILKPPPPTPFYLPSPIFFLLISHLPWSILPALLTPKVGWAVPSSWPTQITAADPQ
ncbi:unnamed protein product, partial [Gulo gulo]